VPTASPGYPLRRLLAAEGALDTNQDVDSPSTHTPLLSFGIKKGKKAKKHEKKREKERKREKKVRKIKRDQAKIQN